MAPPRANTQANRALIIVNSIELALQAAAQAEKLFPHWSVEIEQGAKHQASGSADMLIQTMSLYFTFLILLVLFCPELLPPTKPSFNHNDSTSSILGGSRLS
jgi:hypothetical protein